MLKIRTHSVYSVLAPLILAGTLFCVLFGQGTHFHSIALHFGDHFDIHAHVHAHESHDNETASAENNHEDHRHEVSTASDIIGTLTPPQQHRTDMQAQTTLSPAADLGSVKRMPDTIPTLYDLPPPKPVSSLFYYSSFSLRGPPSA